MFKSRKERTPLINVKPSKLQTWIIYIGILMFGIFIGLLFVSCYINDVSNEYYHPSIKTIQFDLNVGNGTGSGSAPENPQCTNPQIDCNNNGICSYWTGQCICAQGYVTHDAPSTTECNYEQKSQLTAFLLSFFLGEFAAGRFYIGAPLAGIKLFVGLLIFIIPCFACIANLCGCCDFYAGINRFETSIPMFCTVGLWAVSILAVFIWWMVDIVLFGMNDITDANGVSLAPM